MMEELNDDCQLLIIEHLALQDKLALWEATNHLSNRLNQNVIYAWQRQSSYVLNTKKLKENPKYLNILLSNIAPTVQQLFLDDVTLETMEPWRGHSFPRLHHLTYEILEKNDDTMKLMVELFPALTSLYPVGYFDSSIAAKWTQLRKLDLTDSFNDPQASFSQYQALEEIFIDGQYLLPDVLNGLLSLPRLQTLNIGLEKCNEVLNNITTTRGLDIQQMTFHDSIWDFDEGQLRELKNLRKLTLIEDDGFKLEQLQTLVAALPLLEQLNMINFKFFCNEIELWQTVALCPNLNVLNISGMPLYEAFFAKGRRFMLDVLNKRSSVLTLCCHNTGSYENLMRRKFQHSKLKLTFKSMAVDYIWEKYYKLQLVPLKT